MEQGSLEERVLARSVLKHIRKQNKALAAGTSASVGQDYAGLSVGEGKSLIITEAVACEPYIAWTKAMNNAACSGAAVKGVRLFLLLPVDTEESTVKRYMQTLNMLADETGIQILGGQTQVDSACTGARILVTALGEQGMYEQSVREICSGHDIVMTKRTGLLGTDLLARRTGEQLRSRFSESYIRGAFCASDEYSVIPEMQAVTEKSDTSADFHIYYMHDVSHGGVYGALWQLAVRLGKGIEICHEAVLIRQETIELCEFYNLNPYMLEGTGSLLLVTDSGSGVVGRLAEQGIPAAVIGRIQDGQDKAILIGQEKRYLSPVCGDEIYKVLSEI